MQRHGHHQLAPRSETRPLFLSYFVGSGCIQSHYSMLRCAVQDGFRVESTSGQVFDNVDLSDGEWVDYDEKLGESVGIMELEHKFVTHK